MLALEAFASALSYLALALALGQFVVVGFLLPPAAPEELRRALLSLARTALLVFLGAAVLGLVIQGAKLQRSFPSAELLWRYATMAQSGNVWLARSGYALALTAALWLPLRKGARVHAARWLALLALPLVASRSLASHAVAVRDNASAAVIADALHLVVTALWAGGLIALWRALCLGTREWQQSSAWTTSLIKRFSNLALVSVALLGLTGLYQSSIQVGSFAILVGTDYGRVLLIKTLLFALMVSFGAANFFSFRRIQVGVAGSEEAGHGPRAKSLRRIGIECLIGVLIFSATGLLTALPPGVHAAHQEAAAALMSPGVATTEKKYSPAQGASVKIIEPKNGAVVTGDQMPLKFTLRAGKHGHHVHAYVDGELMGMFQSKTGTLTGLQSGRHTLELRVVAEDHRTELDAFDHVEFTVK